jgi:hypothetical protein
MPNQNLTAKNQYRKFETIFSEKELRGHTPNFNIHVSVYSQGRSALSDAGNMWIAHKHMNAEIGTEAAQFPEMEYINGIFLGVRIRILPSFTHVEKSDFC